MCVHFFYSTVQYILQYFPAPSIIFDLRGASICGQIYAIPGVPKFSKNLNSRFLTIMSIVYKSNMITKES